MQRQCETSSEERQISLHPLSAADFGPSYCQALFPDGALTTATTCPLHELQRTSSELYARAIEQLQHTNKGSQTAGTLAAAAETSHYSLILQLRMLIRRLVLRSLSAHCDV